MSDTPTSGEFGDPYIWREMPVTLLNADGLPGMSDFRIRVRHNLETEYKSLHGPLPTNLKIHPVTITGTVALFIYPSRWWRVKRRLKRLLITALSMLKGTGDK